MLTRYDQIKALNTKGYNCAQAVACAYTDLTDLDHGAIYKITEGLGGGMGRMQEMCGALTATFLIMSYLNSDGALADGKTKQDTYAKIRGLNDAFVAKLGSSNCKILLGGGIPKPGLCDDKLQVASEIMEKVLAEMNVNVLK